MTSLKSLYLHLFPVNACMPELIEGKAALFPNFIRDISSFHFLMKTRKGISGSAGGILF
jgi:hypothetical protein